MSKVKEKEIDLTISPDRINTPGLKSCTVKNSMMIDQTMVDANNENSAFLKSEIQALQRSEMKERSSSSIRNSCSGVITA